MLTAAATGLPGLDGFQNALPEGCSCCCSWLSPAGTSAAGNPAGRSAVVGKQHLWSS